MCVSVWLDVPMHECMLGCYTYRAYILFVSRVKNNDNAERRVYVIYGNFSTLYSIL